MIDASPRRLLVYKLVVELGGFNAAALRLGIAQPSVGAHVEALERHVGQPLLHRQRGKRPRPTEAGRIVYDLAVDVVRRCEEAARRLDGMKASRAREIVIAAHRDLAASFLPPRLARFNRDNPKARIVTRIGTIEDVLALVQAGAVQLGLLLCAGPPAGVASQIVGYVPLDLVVAPSHALARATSVDVGSLAGCAFVTGLEASSYAQIVDGALASIGVKGYDVAMELQEATAVKEVVRNGQCVACLPRSTVDSEINSGVLVRLPVEPALPELQVRCAYATPPGPVARRLIAALKHD